MSTDPSLPAVIDTPPPWGPAMAALTDMQRAFVLAKCRNPAISNSQALAAAGSTATGNGLNVGAYRLAHHKGVLAALKEEAEKMTSRNVALAAGVLEEILLDPTHKDRFKVATHVLGMAGMSVVTKTETTHNVNVTSDKEKVAEIVALAARLGMDHRKLLGGEVVIDAEFTPVPPVVAADPDDPFFTPGENQ